MKKNSQEINAVNVLQTLVELWMDQMNVTGSVMITNINEEVNNESKIFIRNMSC